MVSSQGNAPIANNLYGVANGTNSSTPFITVFMTRDPTSNDINYPVKQRWINTESSREWVLTSFTAINGQTTANWLQLSDGDALTQIGVPNGTSPVTPDANGLINFTSNAGSVTITGSASGLGAQNINFDILNFSQGTFTPTIQGTSTAGSPTYTSQIGRYQKVGRIATVNYLVSWSAVGGATGNLQCNGLPFTSANVSGNSTPFLWTDANIAFGPGAGTISVGILLSNTTSWTPASFNATTGANSVIAIPSSGGVAAVIIYETI